MCHFITAVLPRSANHSALAEIAARHGRALKPQRNPSVEEHLKPGEHYFLTTKCHCDCGTTLGALRRAESKFERRKSAAEKEESKLRRKGWSEAKIKRWKEQKAEHLAKLKSTQDATDWEDLLRDMLNSRQTPFVGLLLHWYSSSIEERIELQGREDVKVSAETLGRMREDVLYEFQKQA